MNPSRQFIVRPIATSLIMIAIFLVGVLGFRLLPISSLPEVDYPTIQVTTFYPGASPDIMMTTVTAPLERQFGQMPGLNQMTSSSSGGASVITLQFTLDIALDNAEQEVQAAINAASNYLPRDLPTPPIYNKVNPADAPILTLGLTSDVLSLRSVEDFADTRLANKISQIPGVGLVNMIGGQKPAVRIQANPTALASYGLTLEDLRNAVTASNVNAAKGSFDGPRLAYTINANDQLLTSAEYNPIIISYKNNAPVRLSDVAKTIEGPENVRQAAWMNNKPAIILNIQRQPGANVIAVTNLIKDLLTNLQTSMPRQIQVSVLTDRTLTIRASVNDVQFELMLSIALVILVIFLFLRNLRATIIPSVSIPLSLVGTFAVMYLLGFSLNNLTLMALTIATGFVVDDAIVMIENISRFIEAGDKPLEAALKGSRQIAFTIISLTVSLIAVLIPLLFMQDIVGRFFREFAITVTTTILISCFVSLTLTPMLCAKLLRHHTFAQMNHFEQRATLLFEHLIQKYQRTLYWVLAHESFTLIVFSITVLLTGFLFFAIPKAFFPTEDTGVIQGVSEASESISFQAMMEKQQALANIILKDPAVLNLSSFVGIDGTNLTPNTGRMLITLKPLNERKDKATSVIARLHSKLSVPGISFYMQPLQDVTMDDRVSRTQFQYSVSAIHLEDVANWSNALLNAFQKKSALADVTSDQQMLGLQTMIDIDRATAARLGITPQLIDNILYDAFGQRQIATLFTQRNQYHVILEMMPSLANTPDALNDIYLQSTVNSVKGSSVPLSAFTKISQATGPLVIHRQNQFPVAVLSFNLGKNASLGQAIRAINQTKSDLKLPESVQTEFEGTAKIFQNSLANEGWLILSAIIVVYIILGVLYESYIHPLTILSTLPSAGMGALVALFLTNHTLSVIALIGIILLIGIVMKNAIMMIDFALEQERKFNKNAKDAIYEACMLRFRPIVMTTMASLLGAVPLALSHGMGSELRQPLGIAIIGGLIVSQLLTLYTTPVIYLSLDKVYRRMIQSRRPSANEAV